MRLLCISASNNFKQDVRETSSFLICNRIVREVKEKLPLTDCSIIELKNYNPNPCINCLKCLDSRRCAIDDAFNEIYEKVVDCDVLFIVSPHYAPIPAKLCMVMEKMESISFNPWLKDNSYQSEVYGIVTGIISHGGTGETWALREYKHVVNDPIANALHTIQFKVIPYNDEWKTGISVPPLSRVQDCLDSEYAVFEDYIDKILQAYGTKI